VLWFSWLAPITGRENHKMRILFLTGIAVIGMAAATATTPGELRGTARAGIHPQANAVVWLEAPNAPPARPDRTPVLDQRNLVFAPHVLAVRIGTKVELPNHDRVFHNVFSYHDGKRFDLGLYPVGASKQVAFDKPGLSRIFCNIHPNMAAYVLVVDSPYFAVTDATGAFTIGSVPPGVYAYHAWRAGGPDIDGTATLSGAAPLEVQWP
jgi:plastocyanin